MTMVLRGRSSASSTAGCSQGSLGDGKAASPNRVLRLGVGLEVDECREMAVASRILGGRKVPPITGDQPAREEHARGIVSD